MAKACLAHYFITAWGAPGGRGCNRFLWLPAPSRATEDEDGGGGGLRGTHVFPAPSSAPSAPPRQSEQAQVGTRRAGPSTGPDWLPLAAWTN